MDTFLAIVSKRDTRRYADRPIPDALVDRIFAADRLAGSAGTGSPDGSVDRGSRSENQWFFASAGRSAPRRKARSSC